MKKYVCPLCKKEINRQNTNLRDNFLWVECEEHGEIAMDYWKYHEYLGIDPEDD